MALTTTNKKLRIIHTTTVGLANSSALDTSCLLIDPSTGIYLSNKTTSPIKLSTNESVDLSNYLQLTGGTLTGPLVLPGNKYQATDATEYAIDMSNSDIVNLNAIYTCDTANSANEGFQFKRDNGNYDSIWAANGVFYFSPDGSPVGSGSYSNNYTVIHSGNIGSQSVESANTLKYVTVNDLTNVTQCTFFKGTLKATNMPSTATNYITGITLATDANPQYRLILGLDYHGKVFTRAEQGGVWQGWHQLARTSDIPGSLSSFTNDTGYITNSPSSLEIMGNDVAFIDFHYAKSSNDFDARIACHANNQLRFHGHLLPSTSTVANAESIGASNRRFNTIYAQTGNFSGGVTATGGFTGNVTGNATTATSAQWLSDSTLRRTSLNIAPVGNGKMTKFLATSAATEGHPGQDGHIIHCEWDTTAGWNAQLFLADKGEADANKRMMWRAMDSGAWNTWKSVAFTDGSINYATSSGSCAGTMTGIVTLIGEKYDKPNDTTLYTAMNCNNSNITGVNSITTADNAESGNEGIRFWRSTTTNDCLYASNGVLYFTPNLSIGSSSTANDKVIIHSGNYTDYCASVGHTHSKVLYHKRISSTDNINNITTAEPFVYEVNNNTNLPTNSAWHQIFNWGSGDVGYGVQMTTAYVNNYSMYFRHRTSGTWYDWREILDSSNYTTYCASTGHTHAYSFLETNGSSADVGFQCNGSQYSIAFMIGSGNVNRGIYDRTANAWWMYRGSTSTTNFAGQISCDSSITAKNFITSSDRRLKKNINEISSDKLSNVLNINFYEFDYVNSNNHSAGHIAQEIKDVLPEFVHKDESDDEMLAIDYTGLHSIQIKALLDRIIKLEEEIKILKSSK